MKLYKKILLLLLFVFFVLQFIQPPKNSGKEILSSDITRVFSVPQNVLDVLKTSCYDCHSNNTRYPWYSFIQPGAWWMAHHIEEGKQNLNFSDFGSYSLRRQQNKLRAVINSIKDSTMPLKPYAVMHADATLSNDKKIVVIRWMNKIKDSLALLN
ncbi:MAG: heme-binding domain-containing protein [Ferruginibacter sp.]